jgi:hypothetical protein
MHDILDMMPEGVKANKAKTVCVYIILRTYENIQLAYEKYFLTYCNFGMVTKCCKILFLEFFAKYLCEMTSQSHFSAEKMMQK